MSVNWTWTDVYRAVRVGNTDVIPSFPSISTDRCPGMDLLKLAVTQGHVKLVKLILHTKVKVSLTNEELVQNLLRLALKSGKRKMVKFLLKTLREQNGNPRSGFHNEILDTVATVIEYCNLSVLEEVDSFCRRQKEFYSRVLKQAFKNGRNGVFDHVIKSTKRTLVQAEKLTGIQEFFLAIAVDQGYEEDYYENVNYYRNKRLKDGILYEYWYNDRKPCSAFGVAARFGKLNMLKNLYQRSRDHIDDSEWCIISKEIYQEALRFGHKNILDYLTIIGCAFHVTLHDYLNEQYQNLPSKMYERMVADFIKIIQARSTSKAQYSRLSSALSREMARQLKSSDEKNAVVLIKHFSKDFVDQDFSTAFVQAVEYKCKQVVMYLVDQVNLRCPFSTLGHQALSTSLLPLCNRKQTFPDPVILQSLLESLPLAGSACHCGEIVPMDFFLHFDFQKNGIDSNKFSFQDALRYSETFLRILACRGLIPRAVKLKKLFRLFFSKCEHLNFISTRLVCLADWLDLTDIYGLQILGSGRWFDMNFRDRDLFIFHFLRSFCGSKTPLLRWKGFTNYIYERQNRKIFNQIQNFGIKIEDKLPAPLHIRRDLTYIECRSTLMRRPLHTLQSCCRLVIYASARKKSTNEFTVGRYAPLSSIINEICQQFCPHLKDFMEFRE